MQEEQEKILASPHFVEGVEAIGSGAEKEVKHAAFGSPFGLARTSPQAL
jgi:hypothetical protein